MRRVIRFDFADVRPSETDVLSRLGMPRRANVSAALKELLAEGATRIERSAEPRAVYQEISKADYEGVHRGEGLNAPEAPLDLIAPRADALALFVGTSGGQVSAEIENLFAADPALAMILDAYASETTNRIADRIAVRFLEELRSEQRVSNASRVLPYSPGYCGWHITAQRALFAAIHPDDIGVKLEPSCLMTPIKSVSGVLVAGDATVHRFRPQWAFCDECRTRDCGPRMASVRL